MKNIFLFVGMLFLQHSFINAENDTLILGCRPWDKGISSLNLSADFVDFNDQGIVVKYANYFKHDFNNTGVFGAANFSDFVKSRQEKYQFIVIDWATHHHIRRAPAWQEILSMLKVGGQLVVPINTYSLDERRFTSEDKCTACKNTLNDQNPCPSSMLTAPFFSADFAEFKANAWYSLLARREEETLQNGWLLIATK